MTSRRTGFRNGVIPRAPIERLRDRLRVDPETGCHEWTGALDRKGYARIAIGGHRNRLAYRVAYEAECGAIPERMTLDHLCRNKKCCNPAHLEPVTSAENTRRSIPHRKLKTHCLRGHPLAGGTYGSGGDRECRVCKAARQATRRAVRRGLSLSAPDDPNPNPPGAAS